MSLNFPRFLCAAILAIVFLAGQATAQPTPGTYTYERLPSPGIVQPIGVAFHPDGSYALVITRNNLLHAVNWSDGTVTSYDLTPASGTLHFDDLAFAPDGSVALLVGRHSDTVDEGVVYKFDDAAHRDGLPTASVVSECVAARRANVFVGVEYPWRPGLPMVLGRSLNNSTAYLREFDADARDFTTFLAATATSGGCDDLAFVDNEFGSQGVLVVCGASGAGTHYYTEVGGIGGWRHNPGNTNLGNTSVVAAHPGGDYALVVSWSSRQVYRFEGGLLNAYADAPRFPTLGITTLGFRADGSRALITGRAGGVPLSGTVVEYRHDLYTLADMTPVSIPGFDDPPYLATSSTYISAVAFRPGCDGGLMVAFDSSDPAYGLLVEFTNTEGDPCTDISAVGEFTPNPVAVLDGAAPNPFNPGTTISFRLASGQPVSLEVFDLKGRLVRTLIAGETRSEGPHTVEWNGRTDRGTHAPSGTYVYRLITPGFAGSGKMALLR